jgi:cell division protein FtsI (penicillin-binding protein 3)
MVRANSIESVFRKRIVVLAVLLLISFALIITRLVVLQIVAAKDFQAQADDQRIGVRKIAAKRGEIKVVDRFTGQPYAVATNVEKDLLYAVPPSIQNAPETAEKLAPLLGMKTEDILPKLSDGDRKYVVLKRQIDTDLKQKIADLNIAGLAFEPETVRYYPERQFMSQVLGYVGYKNEDKTGLYGLEQAFDENLRGRPGSLVQEQDASRIWIFGTRRDGTRAVDGDSLILTIDKTIQFKAEQVLAQTVKDNQADSGSIVIADPKTGAIMAMATYPSFDPNLYSSVENQSVFTNQGTMGSYEPGSIFKPLTMAAAVNEGKVTASTTYTDTGELEIDGYKIKNSDEKAHGVQNMSQVLEESLNTGIIFAKEQIGNKKFLEYVKRFGFGQKTGIEVLEAKGDLGNLDGNIGVNYHTASFGQGISVTPLQMIEAYSALANGGKMMKPYLVQSRISPEGEVTKTEPQVAGEVISARTASQVSAMLVNVVEKGHGTRAGVPGYYIAGKTGTAQVPRKDGKGYEENNNIGSFIGYGPVEDPKFLMLVRVNHPRTVRFAETTAAPAFGELAKFMVNYFNLSPTRSTAKK